MKSRYAFLLALFLLLPAFAAADGGIFPPDYYKYADIYEPLQKAAIFYDNGKEDMILQVAYQGEDLNEFAWVVPVPNYPIVMEGEETIFEELAHLTRPSFEGMFMLGGMAAEDVERDVKVHEEKKVGPYDVAVLSATDASALINWLNTNRFRFPAEGQEIVDYYLQKGWYFVAMKINLAEAEPLMGSEQPVDYGDEYYYDEYYQDYYNQLQPIRMSFFSDEIVYPLRISSINAKQQGQATDILIYVIADRTAYTDGDDFYAEYTGLLTAERAADYDTLGKYVKRDMFVTKLRASIPGFKMNSDVDIHRDETGYFFGLFMLALGIVLLLAVLLVVLEALKVKQAPKLKSRAFAVAAIAILVLLPLAFYIAELPAKAGTGQAKQDYDTYRNAIDSGDSALCLNIIDAQIRDACTYSFYTRQMCSAMADRAQRAACLDNIEAYIGV